MVRSPLEVAAKGAAVDKVLSTFVVDQPKVVEERLQVGFVVATVVIVTFYLILPVKARKENDQLLRRSSSISVAIDMEKVPVAVVH